jgi:FAD-dependent oxidoreductase domain-containing protein 1
MKNSVVIVGGGVVGAALAYFLARDHGVRATVLERDPTYRNASSALSASSIRQQFSAPINIALSQASLALMQPWIGELAFVEAGYLYLATEAGAATLRGLNALQRAAGADVRLMDANALHTRWPWLATDGIALGNWGARGEGWFDGPALHQRLRREATALGATFLRAEVTRFEAHGDRVLAAIDSTGVRHAADHVVLAAGAWSAPLAAQLGLMAPISAQKRDVFVFDSPARLAQCPLIIDPSGVWLRPEGRCFLAGAPPRSNGDVADAPLDAIDHGLFDDLIWPTLAARIPALEALRLRSAWAGYYDMNLFDHNAVVGALPGWRNAFIAAGFSGHGMQHAPAVGCALASHIARSEWGLIDLTPLSPERLLRGERLLEANVI